MGRSPLKGNTSQTAPASFEEIFGVVEVTSEEQKRLMTLATAALQRLVTLEAKTDPSPVALYREERQAAINRLKRRIRQLQEALKAAKTTTA